ncbi:unnamed protein product [Medioppia subpectinata]|uniref:C2 domain-containing protein n=1 Tax=Medioppia subpectinata TaxID=1979941 RepID=A0A7R9KRN9_9ACAR|nr:unnamed protein product [Medioppia subpectinata]CAG2108568.1 unnamed protein product [Medioppia subpectinata]
MLQICYDMKAAILYVTIIEAHNLQKLTGGQSPDPFVKCYLLPPRIVDNQRRTRYFYRCLNPKWKQTMVYPNIKLDDFKRKYLELSVWSFSIYTPHIFLGQVVIDLSGVGNELELKTNGHKYAQNSTSGGKSVVRRDGIDPEKWPLEDVMTTTASSVAMPSVVRRPIIATSTRNKLTVLGERLMNRQNERRRSGSSTESSRSVGNELELKTNGHKYAQNSTSGGKSVVRRDGIDPEKWPLEDVMTTTASSVAMPSVVRRPIIATSTRNKLTVLGERLMNRQNERRRSGSSTESSRITNMSQLSQHYGEDRSRERPIPSAAVGLSTHPLLASIGGQGSAAPPYCKLL